MCGIFGYVGSKNVKDIIIGGLHRLEHRGYDAAGIGVVLNPQLLHASLDTRVVIGTVTDLEKTIFNEPWDQARVGIGHVRWPTHGKNVIANAHPHSDCDKSLILVHNGNIDNHAQLRDMLIAKGHRFTSTTDTEVIAHLIEEKRSSGQSILDSIRIALEFIRGTYAFAICVADDPDAIYVARMGSPLVIGNIDDGYVVASEAYAFSNLGNPACLVASLDDDILARVSSNGVSYTSISEKKKIDLPFIAMSIPEHTTSLKRRVHRTHEEIYHQPEVVRQLIAGSFSSDGRSMNVPSIQGAFERIGTGKDIIEQQLNTYDRIVILACGTAYHAGLIGKRYFERLAGIPTYVHRASDFQTGPFNMTDQTLVIAISQSGETWDTRSALATAKTNGRAKTTIALVNNVYTTIEREAAYTFLMKAGQEVGVAATKTFTAQCLSLLLIALAAGEKTVTTSGEIEDWMLRIRSLSAQIQECIEQSDVYLKEMVRTVFERKTHTVFIGRGAQYHIAQEGALKLKEIAYIPSDAQPSKELKHGPLALIDDACLAIVIIPYELEQSNAIELFEQDLNSLAEIRARHGETLVITTKDAPDIESEWLIRVPNAHSFLLPLLTILPLQLLAYHWSVARGFNPDKPRNLAKSVTVG